MIMIKRRLEWAMMGGALGGLIYYTMVCKILNICRRQNIILNIEKIMLKENVCCSIMLGGWVGYIMGNIMGLIRGD
jgi:hypothetical protein